MPSTNKVLVKKRRLSREIISLNAQIDALHNDIDVLDNMASKAKQLLSEKQRQLDIIYEEPK